MDRFELRLNETVWGSALVYWVPAVGYAAAIFYLSSLSEPQEELPSFLHDLSDKLLHLVEYGLFGILWYRVFRWASGAGVATSATLLAIVAGSVYGATDEVHQAFVPLREVSWIDWVADSIGSALGALSLSWIERHRGRPSSCKAVG